MFIYRTLDDRLRLAPGTDMYFDSVDREVRLKFYDLALENHGLFAFAIANYFCTKWNRCKALAFLEASNRERLQMLELPKGKSVFKFLRKLIIRKVIAPEQIEVVRLWLRDEGAVPKTLAHAQQLDLAWVNAVARQPWLMAVPYPEPPLYRPWSFDDMTMLKTLVDECLESMQRLRWNDTRIRQRLENIPDLQQLETLPQELSRELHLQQLARRRVLPPLRRGHNIWAPETLADFRMLALDQHHCVDSYFTRALQGYCAIYAVMGCNGPRLTAELIRRNGIWLPFQVLAQHNTIPTDRYLLDLMHWLASSQINNATGYSYRQNLARIFRWLGERSFRHRKYAAWELHWTVQSEAIQALLKTSQRQPAQQMDLRLGSVYQQTDPA